MNDYDLDGCQDISEDNDDDNDNILDSRMIVRLELWDGSVAPPTTMIRRL